MPRALSVIIPTLNEERQIASVIEQTRQAGECEIIVVDGGSSDGTLERTNGADQVFQAPPGRASQQNAGAAAAEGEVFLFLHADCRLPTAFDLAVEQALLDARCSGGCFRQRIEHPDWRYRLIERGNVRRVKTLGWIYGDQGLFVRRADFERLGRFPAMPLMEDLYFSKRLRRAGALAVLDLELRVSPRRWEQKGVVRQTLRNWSFVAMAHAGVRPERLARWYGHVRE